MSFAATLRTTATEPTVTPRHRAETSRSQAFADLRRRVALVVVGRDLYADDRVLRGEAPRPAGAALPA